MNGGIRQLIVVSLILVISFLVGSQISGDVRDSMGAFLILVGIISLIAFVIFSTKVWYIAYIGPAAVALVAVFPATRFLQSYPFGLACGVLTIVLWILLRLMNKVRFSWRSAPVLDILVLILMGLFVAHFIQRPVSVNVLGFEGDSIGGKEYIYALLAAGYYLCLSTVRPTEGDEATLKIFRAMFFCTVAVQTLVIISFFAFPEQVVYRYAEEAQKAAGEETIHYYQFVGLSAVLLYYVCAASPLFRLFYSPKSLLLSLVSVCGILLGGGREVFLRTLLACAYLYLVKREFLSLLLCGGAVYMGLFALGEDDILEKLPAAMQRPMGALPGIKIGMKMKRSGEGTAETRKMIWSYALDPRTGVIKDYVLGDGFGESRAAVYRYSVAVMRGSYKRNATEFAMDLAKSGSLHNGWLTLVHRTGIIGFIVVNLIYIVALWMVACVSRAFFGRKEYPFLMVACLPYVAHVLSMPWGTQVYGQVFNYFVKLAQIKVLYCIAKEQGLVELPFRRKRYIPMMVRETSVGVGDRNCMARG